MSELDEAPADWTRWSVLKGARVDVDQSNEWQRVERPPETMAQEARRLRGSQAEPGHHLGRGTKWLKPGSTK